VVTMPLISLKDGMAIWLMVKVLVEYIKMKTVDGMLSIIKTK